MNDIGDLQAATALVVCSTRYNDVAMIFGMCMFAMMLTMTQDTTRRIGVDGFDIFKAFWTISVHSLILQFCCVTVFREFAVCL